MRFPNSRLIRLGSLTQGAIVEPGDGELVVPPVLQMEVELPSPIGNIQNAGATLTDSQEVGDHQEIAGAQAGSSLTLCTLTKGLWRVHLFFSGQFKGTDAVAQRTGIQVLDPAGTGRLLMQMNHISPTNLISSATWLMLCQEDGWVFARILGVTIAGDVLGLNTQAWFNRLT